MYNQIVDKLQIEILCNENTLLSNIIIGVGFVFLRLNLNLRLNNQQISAHEENPNG